MNTRERLDQYLDEVRRRLRTVIVARAGGAIALAALVLTAIAVWALQSSGLQPRLVLAARIGLFVVLLAIAVAMLWRPLSALRPRNRARELEKHLPSQGGRIQTYLELAQRREQGLDAPLLDLLAEDALTIAEQTPTEQAVPRKRMFVPAAIGGAALAVLIGLMSLNNFWGAGTRHLWFGVEVPKEQIIVRNIDVAPGDAVVRRNQDLPISALPRGFKPSDAAVHVRFGNSDKWETAKMHPGNEGGFEFTLFAVRENLSYYVSAGGVKSAEHKVSVVDAPRIEKVRLTYEYPEWTGLAPETTESSRDIHAVAGTKVTMEIQTTAPLESPTLDVNGSASPLESNGNVTRGTLVVEKPGYYRIHARVGDEHVALSDQHEISLIDDEKPVIEVAKPARDWRATSIEEVPVHVRAKDDFRVQGLELRYSVNGGEWKSVPLKGRAKDVEAKTVLRLEELGPESGANTPRLTPGDVITYYAVARDRKQAVQTDLFLIQVQPFDRRFTQGGGGSQGGAGAGEDQQMISERQREILLATWNLQRQRENPRGREAERIRDNARMLAELQSTLASQAQTLIARTQARALLDADPKIKQFVQNLQLAVEAMQPAAKHLSELELQAAIPPEQKALQHLLRAEALVTEIQVSFQNASAGAGGQAGRDLAEMFELEMDLEKNQYETESRSQMDPGSSQELNEAIRKLRELAQRQERLAREAANQQLAQREQQRWRQEQLKLEAEELRRKLEQLAQRSGGQSQQGQSQNGQQSSSGNATAQQALEQVQKAIENMQASASGSQQESSGAKSAQQASRDLQRALEKIEQGQREGLAGNFRDLADRARSVLEEQRKGESELHQALSASNFSSGQGFNSRRLRGLDWERAEALAQQKRELQAQLQALERDMRTSAQKHKNEAPEASRQLSTAATNLAESNVSAGLARSALELERGRVLEAAAREPLITEVLEALQRDLDDAARVASAEAKNPRRDEEASPEELLAELSELRRAWQEAQNRQGDRLDENGRVARNGGQQGQESDQQNGESSEGQPGQGQQAGDTRQANAAGGPQDGGFSPGTPDPAGANTRGGSWNGIRSGDSWGHSDGWRNAWNTWDRPLAGDLTRRPVNSAEFQAQAEEIARRLREMIRRMPKGALPDDDMAALRQLADRLRQMNRDDPMESQYAQMFGLVDKIELAALTAADKARANSPRRATTQAADSPQYRENVAEYYRRLGRGAESARP